MARRSIQRTVTGRTPLTSFRSLLAAVALLAPFLLLGSCTNAFSISSSTVSRTRTPSCGARPAGAPSRCLAPSNRRGILQPTAFQGVFNMKFQSQKLRPSSTTTLSMYNLPPGGGGGGAKNDIAEIAKGAVSLLLVIGFFVSPLGGFVLSIFNSFLLLLFVLPLLATVGFQAWSSLNTVKGECPNCGAPAQVMKNQDSGSNVVDDFGPAQSICFNCGAILQANEDNSGINNVSGRTSLDDLDSQMGGASLFDLFSSTTSTTTTTTSTSATTSPNKVDKGSVIDVDVLDEDKPFQ
mmetsp:Transcript_22893/g.54041  ORF Transcript_22893/g.54041 Transcript_22893/m.54041 type:complete len:294 (+) Transcript_22893:152-1033(+)